MVMTFVRPTAGENCGPGFLWNITFTALAPVGSRAHGTLTAGPTGFTGVDLQTNNIGAQSAAGVIGTVYPALTPLMSTPYPGVAHGAAGNLHIDVITPANVTIESGDVAITLDMVTGLPYLTTIFGPVGAGGHDPMLDTILADVQHTYVNSP